VELVAAVEVFAHGFAAVRSLHHPYLVRRRDAAFILEDAPRSRPEYRKTEVIAADPDPQDMAALLRSESEATPHRRLCLSAIYADTDRMRDALERYKRLGFRLHSREGFYALQGSLAPRWHEARHEVRHVRTAEEIESFRKASGTRVMNLRDLTDPKPQFRGFLAWRDGRIVGMLRSVHVDDERTWCSGLWVDPDCRRQGYGASLMAAMIADDRSCGYRANVLSASKLGEPLYDALGYDRIGTLCFLYPPKS